MTNFATVIFVLGCIAAIVGIFGMVFAPILAAVNVVGFEFVAASASSAVLGGVAVQWADRLTFRN